MAFGDKKSSSKFNLGSIVGNEVTVNKAPDTIAIDKLKPYNNGNQPFKMYDESKMADLVESIRTNGQLQPVIVRTQSDGNYEILAGHNRVEACKKLDLSDVKAVVLDNVTDAQAQLIVVDTNLCQRQKLLPSERAAAYKMQQEALQKMGVTSATSQVAEMYGENRKTVQRYIALNKLNKKLLDRLDNEEITLNDAVSLSALPSNVQFAASMYADCNNALTSKTVEKIVANKDEIIDVVSINNLQKQQKDKCDTMSQQKFIKLKIDEFEEVSDMPPEAYQDFLYFCLQNNELKKEFVAFTKHEQYKQDVIDHVAAVLSDVGYYKKNKLTTAEFAQEIKRQHRWSGNYGGNTEYQGVSGGVKITFKGADGFDAFSKTLSWTEIAKNAELIINGGRYDEAKRYAFSPTLYEVPAEIVNDDDDPYENIY